MRVSLFDFDLPKELIATRPAQPRDAARLLVVGVDRLSDSTVRDLPDLLDPGDVLVFNDTRVIPARLVARLPSGGRVELTLHKALAADRWLAFARPARKLKPGLTLRFGGSPTEVELSASVERPPRDGEVELLFDRGGAALRTALARIGEVPLPPYIARPGGEAASDREDYQTIYARRDGAVAAPTAGLHFTPDLFERLDRRGIGRAMVTLHVGAGTFLPVKVEDTAAHVMHSEWGEVSAEAARLVNERRAAGGRVVAVGTTSLRLLESAAGDDGVLAAFSGDTALFITPGYRFKIVDRLLTNFHLPKSTLFMLVSAFAGLERMQQAYAHARAARYRFYSYGDACLLDRPA